MNLFATASDMLLWLLAAALIAAAIQDAVQLKISNLIVLAVLALAVCAALATGVQIGVWQNFAVFALVLAVGTMMFSRGILGGGDVKLLAAVALWTDFPDAARLIASIFIFGGILALVIVFGRVVAPTSVSTRLAVLKPKAGTPYDIAIAVGTLFMILVSKPEPPSVYVPKGVTVQP